MRKWDGKPTSTLETEIHELQGKTIRNGGSSRKIPSPVSNGQFPRQSGRDDFTSSSMERNSNLFLQELSGDSYDPD